MGSSAQVIVGGMLLVTAFLFGRYINDQPLVPKQSVETELVENDLPLKPIVTSSTPKPFSFGFAGEPAPKTAVEQTTSVVPTPDVLPAPELTQNSDPNSLQRTLRDRILGERRIRRSNTLPNNEIVRTDVEGSFMSSEPLLEKAGIAVPDFSFLEDSELKNESPLPEPSSMANRLTPIEVPTFDSLKRENELMNDVDSVPFNDTRGVIVGPVHDLAKKRIVDDRSSRFGKTLPLMPPRNNPRFDSGNRLGNFQPNIESTRESRRFSRSDFAGDRVVQSKRSTSSGTFNQDRDLVPVRHRESRLTTEVTKFIDYTTVFGDTLHGLSSRFFGKPDYYLDIYLANKEKFTNPAKVPVNTKLRIPVMTSLISEQK